MKLIAFYLPQFHPTLENDKWWGEGFTEWTNVKKARSLFGGHVQPNFPRDVGYYDLRDPEIRQTQAEIAKKNGIGGFCYWHYWFAGKRMLELPFQDVLISGKPDFPFCLGWANDSWTGIWHGAPGRLLIEQTYPGLADEREHFYKLLDAFKDPRYIRIEGKPIFLIYKPQDIPEVTRFIKHWNELATREGLEGIYFIANIRTLDDVPSSDSGFSAAIPHNPGLTLHHHFRFFNNKWYRLNKFFLESIQRSLKSMLGGFSKPYIFPYGEYAKNAISEVKVGLDYYQCIVPNWDNTPRCGVDGFVLGGSSPELFRLHLQEAINKVKNNTPEKRIIFLKSWNEWAEGNYLEPDEKFGYAYLDACRAAVYGV